MMPENKDNGWIRMKFHREQVIPLDDKGYSSLAEFFNAMVTEYKHRIENKFHESDHVLVTYQNKNYTQQLYLFPTDEDLRTGVLDRFTLSFCRKYKPKYLFRMSGAYINEDTKETGFVCYAEDRDELLTKKFRIVKHENTMTLTEISSERSAGDEDPQEYIKRWEARYGKKEEK